MSIYREKPDYKYLKDVIELFGTKQKNEYIIDYTSYKKILFHNYHINFLNELLNYYHKSKTFYITRKFTFSSFLTIIRHLCKLYDKKYRYIYDKNQHYSYLKYYIIL